MFGKLKRFFGGKDPKKQMAFKKTLKTTDAEFGITKTLGTGASCKVKLGLKIGDKDKKPIAIKLLKENMEGGINTWGLCQTEIEIMA